MPRSSDALRGPFPDQVSRTQHHENDHDRELDIREMLDWSANPYRSQSDFSAVTVFRESRRVIIVNEAHSEVRQASSLTHELAHLLLPWKRYLAPEADRGAPRSATSQLTTWR
jgi:Zn-dependent peptidase ImmA (M78 family)